MKISKSLAPSTRARFFPSVVKLSQVGVDPETGTFDIDRIATGISTSQRGRIILVREALSRLESRMGKLIPVEEVKKEEKTEETPF